MIVLHQVMCSSERVTAVRERIERRLGVETTARPLWEGRWAIYFDADPAVDLDFLRPDVLPPKAAGDGHGR